MMKDKLVLVLGMARSGVAVAKLLLMHGARVRINDIKTQAQLSSTLDPLRGLEGIEWRLGEGAADCLEGVDVLLISPGVPIDSPAVLKAQSMGIEVTGELEVALRYCKGDLIAITGTNGKTTTTTLVGEIMKRAGKRTHVVGNIGYPVSAIAADSRDGDAIVCEVSSFQFETVRDFHPKVSAILNISEDHLYRHRTMENYIAHKARVFMNQGAGDALVLNFGDPVLRTMQPPTGVDLIWFGRGEDVPHGAFVANGRLCFGVAADHREICSVDEIRIRGEHNLDNALAATAIAVAMGVAPEVIRESLREFGGVEHRLEFVRELGGVRYINDSKGTNVDSTSKAIAAMERDTVLMLGGQNKDADFAPLAQIVANSDKIKRVVILGETEDVLASALESVGISDYVRAGYDFDRAIALAGEMARDGWNVLFSPSCKSFDMFSDYEQRGCEFKRRVHAL